MQLLYKYVLNKIIKCNKDEHNVKQNKFNIGYKTTTII